MARWIAVLLSAAVLVAGCSSDRDKGKNKDRDMPKPADRATATACTSPTAIGVFFHRLTAGSMNQSETE